MGRHNERQPSSVLSLRFFFFFCLRCVVSPGLALVTADQCLLWTDGRYFAQALQEMRTEWTLMRIMEDVGVEQWIAQVSPGVYLY